MELSKLLATEQESQGFVLRPCPFCGKDAHLMGTDDNQGLVAYFVKCTGCGASSDFTHRRHLTIQMWNRRT